jgi:hypothetical protein
MTVVGIALFQTEGRTMTGDRLEEFPPASGDTFPPALGKLWAMLVVFALMVPVGALAAYCWWYEIPFLGRFALTAKAGIVGLAAVPLGALLAVVAAALLASAKPLVIGADCVQLLSWGRVVVQIPYQNVAEVYARGEGGAGVVGLRLRDRADAATLVPSWTKDRYEIQVLTYGKPLEYVYQLLSERLAAFRSAGK